MRMNNICKISIILIALLHVVKMFVPAISLPLLFFLTLLLLVFGFPLQGKGFRKITLFFLLTGSAILVYYQMPLESWMQSLVSMTNVIAIIAVMQLFTLPIEIGGYSRTVGYWLRKSFKKESSLFFFSMAVTHVFSSFLLFGTVPVMVSLFSGALKDNIPNYKRFLAAAIVRGYAMAIFWTPGAVIMLLALQVTNVAWFDLFLPGFLLSQLGLFTSYLFEHFTRLNRPISSTVKSQEASPEETLLAYRQSAHIVLVVLGLLILVAFFEFIALGSGTGRILRAGLMVTSLWLLYYRNHAQMGGALFRHWESGIAKAADLAVLFVAMGLFAGAVDHSGILIQFQPAMQNWVNQLGLVSIVVIPLIYILLAVTGIHPFILIVILGKILTALSLPLSPVSIALLLLLASSVSFIVSPFAGMVLMTAKFLNVRPMEVAIKWNAAFCMLFLAEGIIFACLWK